MHETLFDLSKFSNPIGTPKAQLAKILQVSERNIYHLCEFASNNVDDFLEDYPKVKSEPITIVPLTQYQCWVICLIQLALKAKIPKKLLSTKLFEPQYQHKFSKAAFNEYLEQLGRNQNEPTTISRVPLLTA